MILVDLLMIIAILLQAYSLSLNFMYISRFLFGIFCGISSAIIPPYLTSISPLDMTGIIGSFNQLLITIGISVAYSMDFFL
jgi:SP family galactose:H+ symporter-like MFS transporter